MLVYDIETDGLLDELTRIHCLNVVDRETRQLSRYNRGVFDDGTPCPSDGPIEVGLERLATADCIGGHNVIPFDNPAIQKCYPGWAPKGRVRDSLAEVRVIWSDIFKTDLDAIKRRKRSAAFVEKRYTGRHSLGAWGFRLGVLKGEFSPAEYTNPETGEPHTWVTIGYTAEMAEYADQDPVVNAALFDKIDEQNFSTEALELETAVAGIIHRQELHGFLFDVAAAEKLLAKLLVRHAELEDELRKTFKPWWAPKRKGGRHEVIVPKRDNRKQGYTEGCPATKVELVVFNPSSRDHIADRMQTLFGWQPVDFTDTGKPTVDETTLVGLNYPEAKLLTEYLTVDKRIGQLFSGKQAWLSAVKKDGRIHGRVNPNGAVTGRMTHSSPNIAQAPATYSLYGEAMRSLFCVAHGYLLVGCDAEGLELRMLGHYLARFDGGSYADTVVNGDKSKGTDVHTVNQRLIGLNTRDAAKTWIYAYLYGAGNLKLGSVVYDDFTDAQRERFNARYAAGKDRETALARLGLKARKGLEGGMPALGKLQELVKKKAARGFLLSLDGRRLKVRSQHAALNTLLQGAGAVVMKKALVLLDETLQLKGWVPGVDYEFVANVHDEFQMEVKEHLAPVFGAFAAEAITAAGEAFGLKCPLAGAFAIGRNWAETH